MEQTTTATPPGGTTDAPPPPPPPGPPYGWDRVPAQRFRRAVHGRMVAGVAAGLADYVDVDVVVVRVVLVVLALVGGIGVPLYLAAWLLVPEEGTDESVAERLLDHPLHTDDPRRNDVAPN
jgi:phage shock protein PspC (stress-responsive transcriptional regulator)